MAMKVLSNEEYTAFEKEYNDLSNSENREEELSYFSLLTIYSDKLSDKWERDLYLLGATAVEDKL
jgi:magnesium-transporting ATPase (P-type)